MEYIAAILPNALSFFFVIKTCRVKIDSLTIRQLIFLRSIAVMSILLFFAIMVAFTSWHDREIGAIAIMVFMGPFVTASSYLTGLLSNLRQGKAPADFWKEEDRLVFAALRIYVICVFTAQFGLLIASILIS